MDPDHYDGNVQSAFHYINIAHCCLISNSPKSYIKTDAYKHRSGIYIYVLDFLMNETSEVDYDNLDLTEAVPLPKRVGAKMKNWIVGYHYLQYGIVSMKNAIESIKNTAMDAQEQYDLITEYEYRISMLNNEVTAFSDKISYRYR